MNRESEARERWMSWSPTDRKRFLNTFHYDEKFYTYTWVILPDYIQGALMNRKYVPESPTITAECGHCRTVYTFTDEIKCPRCGFTGISWAYHGEDAAPLAEQMRNENILSDPGTPLPDNYEVKWTPEDEELLKGMKIKL